MKKTAAAEAFVEPGFSPAGSALRKPAGGCRVSRRKINGRCTGDPAVQYRPVSAGGAARQLALAKLAFLFSGR